MKRQTGPVGSGWNVRSLRRGLGVRGRGAGWAAGEGMPVRVRPGARTRRDLPPWHPPAPAASPCGCRESARAFRLGSGAAPAGRPLGVGGRGGRGLAGCPPARVPGDSPVGAGDLGGRRAAGSRGSGGEPAARGAWQSPKRGCRAPARRRQGTRNSPVGGGGLGALGC